MRPQETGKAEKDWKYTLRAKVGALALAGVTAVGISYQAGSMSESQFDRQVAAFETPGVLDDIEADQAPAVIEDEPASVVTMASGDTAWNMARDIASGDNIQPVQDILHNQLEGQVGLAAVPTDLLDTEKTNLVQGPTQELPAVRIVQ